MKNLILFLGVLLIGNTAMAQEKSVDVSNKENTHLVEVEDGLYKVLITNDESKLRQVGFYKEKIQGKLVKDGLWRMYDDDGSLLVTASFKDNKLVWIKPRDQRKYTSEEIKQHRSRSTQSLVSN